MNKCHACIALVLFACSLFSAAAQEPKNAEENFRQTVFPLDKEREHYAQHVKLVEDGKATHQQVRLLSRYFAEKARELLPRARHAKQVRVRSGLMDPSMPEKQYAWLLQVSAHLDEMAKLSTWMLIQQHRDPLLKPMVDMERAPAQYEAMRKAFITMRANNPVRETKE